MVPHSPLCALHVQLNQEHRWQKRWTGGPFIYHCACPSGPTSSNGTSSTTQIIIRQSEDRQMHVEHRAPTVSNKHIIHTIISPIDPSQSIVGSQLRQMVSLQLPSPLLHVDAPHSTPVSACCFKLIIINKFNIIFIFYFIQVDFQVNFNSFGVSVNRTDTAVSLRTESSPNGQFDQV